MARLAQALGFAVIAVALGACGGKRDAIDATAKKDYDAEESGINVAAILGVQKNPPDEFAVISKRPLEMPTDLAALPAPQPGARSLRDPDPMADARTALLGEDATVTAASTRTSASEAALLSAVAANNPTATSTLAAEETSFQPEDDSFLLDRMLGAQDRRGLIDPNAERERLAEIRTAPAAPGGEAPVATIPVTTTSSAPITAPAAVPSAPATDGELIYIPE